MFWGAWGSEGGGMRLVCRHFRKTWPSWKDCQAQLDEQVLDHTLHLGCPFVPRPDLL